MATPISTLHVQRQTFSCCLLPPSSKFTFAYSSQAYRFRNFLPSVSVTLLSVKMESALSAIGTLLRLDLSTKKPSITFSEPQGQFSRFDVPSPDQLIEGSKVSTARVPIIVKPHSTPHTEPEIPLRPEKVKKAAEETPDQRKKRLNKPYTAVFTER